jgi:hypothetical protein
MVGCIRVKSYFALSSSVQPCKIVWSLDVDIREACAYMIVYNTHWYDSLTAINLLEIMRPYHY